MSKHRPAPLTDPDDLDEWRRLADEVRAVAGDGTAAAHERQDQLAREALLYIANGGRRGVDVASIVSDLFDVDMDRWFE